MYIYIYIYTPNITLGDVVCIFPSNFGDDHPLRSCLGLQHPSELQGHSGKPCVWAVEQCWNRSLECCQAILKIGVS